MAKNWEQLCSDPNDKKQSFEAASRTSYNYKSDGDDEDEDVEFKNVADDDEEEELEIDCSDSDSDNENVSANKKKAPTKQAPTKQAAKAPKKAPKKKKTSTKQASKASRGTTRSKNPKYAGKAQPKRHSEEDYKMRSDSVKSNINKQRGDGTWSLQGYHDANRAFNGHMATDVRADAETDGGRCTWIDDDTIRIQPKDVFANEQGFEDSELKRYDQKLKKQNPPVLKVVRVEKEHAHTKMANNLSRAGCKVSCPRGEDYMDVTHIGFVQGKKGDSLVGRITRRTCTKHNAGRSCGCGKCPE